MACLGQRAFNPFHSLRHDGYSYFVLPKLSTKSVMVEYVMLLEGIRSQLCRILTLPYLTGLTKRAEDFILNIIKYGESG